MNKIILSDFKSFDKVGKGLNDTADAVKSTLGPQGQNVMIQHNDGRVTVTKDGVTVASLVTLKDPLENIGAQLIKDVANKTVDVSGDGTTTATLLTQAIFNHGRKNIAAGANSMELKKGLDIAVGAVVNFLKSISCPVVRNDEYKTVATIAANNNEFIGGLIAEAFEKVGPDGIITIEEGKESTTAVKYMDGMQFDRGFQSPHYITDHQKQEVVLEEPYIIFHDRKIKDVKELIPVIEAIAAQQGSILIISDGLEDEAFATIIFNKTRVGLKVCSVNAPLFGDWRRPVMDDLAIVTGGVVISEEFGMRLTDAFEQRGEAIFGRADKVVVTKDRTVIVRGRGKSAEVTNRVESIRKQLEGADGGFVKDQLKKRLARITGGIAVISVGAATEIEMMEIKDRIEDSLQATKAASEEGIIPGGGVSLLRAVKALDGLVGENEDQNTGIKIIRGILQSPIRTILENAGEQSDVVINELLTTDSIDYGYNAKSRKFEAFKQTGIMDPTKVVRLCIENAASVAGMLLTSKTLIYNDAASGPEEVIHASGRSFNDLV